MRELGKNRIPRGNRRTYLIIFSPYGRGTDTIVILVRREVLRALRILCTAKVDSSIFQPTSMFHACILLHHSGFAMIICPMKHCIVKLSSLHTLIHTNVGHMREYNNGRMETHNERNESKRRNHGSDDAGDGLLVRLVDDRPVDHQVQEFHFRFSLDLLTFQPDRL